MTLDKFRQFIDAIRPQGSSWSGPGAASTMDAIARALAGDRDGGSLVERIERIPRDATPFETQYRSVLEQYYNYLRVVYCVPIPTDTEDLRSLVVESYTARSAAFASGFRARVQSYLPLVSIDDRPPSSVLPFELPAPLDVGHAVELWYTPLVGDTEEIVRCTAEAFAPAKSPIRVVAPALVFNNPDNGSLAGDMALQWLNMLASDSPATTDMRVTLSSGGPVDTATPEIERSGIEVLSDLLPGTAAGDNVSGYAVDVSVTRTWAGDTRQILVDSYVFP